MKKFIFHPITIFLFSIISMIMIFSLNRSANEIKKSGEVLNKLEKEVSLQEENIENLKIKLEEASTDFRQEQIIRDELLLQKPGEYIIQINLDQDNQHNKQDLPNQHDTPWEAWKKLLW